MPRTHDPFACPNCRSTRTRSLQMIALTGTRTMRGRKSSATIGARGWWSLSRTDLHATSQTLLAGRIAPHQPTSVGPLVFAIAVAYAFFGPWAIAAILIAWFAFAMRDTRESPEGFLCLRCGHQFDPRSGRTDPNKSCRHNVL